MAAAASESEEDLNFWPGYVDTLVNMVMFLIMLIMVLAVAVMFFAIKARNDALRSVLPMEEPTKTANEQVYPGMADVLPKNPTMEDMRRLIDRLQKKIQLNETRFNAGGASEVLGKVESPKPGESPTAEVVDDKTGKGEKVQEATPTTGTVPNGVQGFALRPTTVIVRFRPGALDMNDAEAKRLDELFKQHFDYSPGASQNFALTVDAVEGLSESNRMAFYRLVAVRNRLMSSSGVPVSRMTQKILPVPVNTMSGTEALEVRITKVN